MHAPASPASCITVLFFLSLQRLILKAPLKISFATLSLSSFFSRATFASSCGFSRDSAAYIDSTPDDIYVRCSLHSSILNRLSVQPKSWSCHRSRRSIPAVLLTSPGTTITRPNDRYCPATNSPLSACRQPPRASPGPPTTIRP